MKKKWIMICLLCIISLILCFLVARSAAVKFVQDLQSEQAVETDTWNGSDPGEDHYDWNEQNTIDASEAPAYWALTELALEYNNKIPFALGGRYGRTGYPVVDSGIDNRYHPEDSKMGMDSLGYIMWLYRNLFGTYDGQLEDPTSMYTDCSVSIDELRIGDVGMITLDRDGNHFGICVGFIEDKAVFSHCDSAPHQLYPGGVNRLTFLASQTDEYLEGQAPTDFLYFVRPMAEWESGIYE